MFGREHALFKSLRGVTGENRDLDLAEHLTRIQFLGRGRLWPALQWSPMQILAGSMFG